MKTDVKNYYITKYYLVDATYLNLFVYLSHGFEILIIIYLFGRQRFT